MRPVLRSRRTALLAAALVAGPFLLTVAQPAAAAASCQVDYQIQAQWPNGFVAGITIDNFGPPISGWTLVWTFPVDGQTVANGHNANFHQDGRVVTVTNLPFNSNIGTGQNLFLGFNGGYTSTNPRPTDFTLNGQPCTATGGGPNAAPLVSVTSPQFGATLPAGSDIGVTANASDPDGTVAEVRFFARLNTASTPLFLGADTTSPYFVFWPTSFTGGLYVLTAVARDDRGAVTTSAPVLLTLVAAPPTSSPTPTPHP
jgi:hypothetical protein